MQYHGPLLQEVIRGRCLCLIYYALLTKVIDTPQL